MQEIPQEQTLSKRQIMSNEEAAAMSCAGTAACTCVTGVTAPLYGCHPSAWDTPAAADTCLSVCPHHWHKSEMGASTCHPDSWKTGSIFFFHCNAENIFTLGSVAAQEVLQQVDLGGKYCSSLWHRQEWCEAAALPGHWHLLRNLCPSSNLVPMKSIWKSL